jgi:hypothetical protein
MGEATKERQPDGALTRMRPGSTDCGQSNRADAARTAPWKASKASERVTTAVCVEIVILQDVVEVLMVRSLARAGIALLQSHVVWRDRTIVRSTLRNL